MSPNAVMLLLGAALIITVLFLLNRRSINKFQYSFVSKDSLLISLAYTACFLGGIHLHSEYSHTVVVATAWLLIAFGVVLIGLLVRYNCRHTNLRYGLCGSAIQVPLLLAGSFFALPILALAMFFKLLAGTNTAPPSPGKTFHQKEEEWYFNPMNQNGFHKRK
ncbi:MAG TPA: hypothetical protein VMW07_07260 [Gallionella sp.]|nr:hypothetical protein [Gallionella sp.]